MFETVTIGDCTLYCGDSTEILPTLGVFDACVCDPPYEFASAGGKLFGRDDFCLDKIRKTGLDKGFDCNLITPEQFRSAVVFCHNDQLAELLPYFAEQYRRYALCCWHKSNPMPVANRNYKPDTEFYIHAWQKDAHPIGDLNTKARYFMGPTGSSSHIYLTCNCETVKPYSWKIKHQYQKKIKVGKLLPKDTCEKELMQKIGMYQKKDGRCMGVVVPVMFKSLCEKSVCENCESSIEITNHPTQKPISLMLKIIENVNGDNIVDPFMGTGTTGVACVKRGRKFTGIERERKYFDIACERIEDAHHQPDFFITTKQKDFQNDEKDQKNS